MSHAPLMYATEANGTVYVEPSKAFRLICSHFGFPRAANRLARPGHSALDFPAPASDSSSDVGKTTSDDSPSSGPVDDLFGAFGQDSKMNPSSSSAAATPHAPSLFSEAPAVDASTIRSLQAQARNAKSISCISALSLTMDTLGVQASLSRRLVRMARCAYGLKLEMDLRTTLRSFLGRDGLQEPTHRVKELGVLPDGRKVLITGRCDALVNPGTGSNGRSAVIPVEIKSRTRVQRIGNIIRHGHAARAFESEWSFAAAGSARQEGTRSLSSGTGDATQSLLYMWLYGATRLLYVQCARIGASDPLVPIISEIEWNDAGFQAVRDAILRSLSRHEPTVRSSSARRRTAGPANASANVSANAPANVPAGSRLAVHRSSRMRGARPRPLRTQTKRLVNRVYPTRLLKQCASVLERAGISVSKTRGSRRGFYPIRTRRQRAAFIRATRMYGSNRRIAHHLA